MANQKSTVRETMPVIMGIFCSLKIIIHQVIDQKSEKTFPMGANEYWRKLSGALLPDSLQSRLIPT